MPPTILPTIGDPNCLDSRRMPAGMVDPVYDAEAMSAHAGRNAAFFLKCHETCPRKACRTARACLSEGALFDEGACRSPDWDDAARLLSVYLFAHAENIRERHRAWDVARQIGADLPLAEPWPADEEEKEEKEAAVR